MGRPDWAGYKRGCKPQEIKEEYSGNEKIYLLTLAVLLGACDVHLGYHADDWKTADAATDLFHKYSSQGQFSAIYGMASDALKNKLTEQEFVQAAEQSMQIYGPIKVARQLRSACFPNQVRLLYQTEFQNGKEWRD